MAARPGRVRALDRGPRRTMWKALCDVVWFCLFGDCDLIWTCCCKPLRRLRKRKAEDNAVGEEHQKDKAISGQTPAHIAGNILLQIVLIIVFIIGVEHEVFPKTPDVPDYPGLGEPGGPISIEAESVIPFKRYPPGFDVYGPQVGGKLSARLKEKRLEYPFKFFIEIATYVYLGFAVQYSFLRKFGYSTMSFGLLQATVAAQWAIIWMQYIDTFHCSYLRRQFVTVDIKCDLRYAANEITGTWKEKQIRQACTCERWAAIATNRSIATELPHQAHHVLLTVGKMDFARGPAGPIIRMTYQSMIEGLLATVPVQITYGMLLGKVGPSQLMVCSIMCVTAYGLNFWITMYMFGGWDHAGGSVVIHTFGVYFGIGCTLLASGKGAAQNPDNAPRYNADVLSLVGVILNWMTFPSFNAYYAPARAQQAVVVNTYLSQFSSCVAAMVFSSLYSGQFKMDPADVQRSSIAGGVAISSVVSIFCKPWEAMIIGFCGGAACSTSHHYLRRFMEKKLGITDTVGAISLHAVPSTVAWIAGILKVRELGTEHMGKWQGQIYTQQQTRTLPYELEYGVVFQRNMGGSETALYQALIMPITIGVATVSGLLTGAVAMKIKGLNTARTFSDSIFWEVPEDFRATEDALDGRRHGEIASTAVVVKAHQAHDAKSSV